MLTGPKIMLADSSVVNVSASENKDLFWALKGEVLILVRLKLKNIFLPRYI